MKGKVLIKAESKLNLFSIICFIVAVLLFILAIILIESVDKDFGILFLVAVFFLIVGLVLLSLLNATITVTTSFVYVETNLSERAIPVSKITGVKKGRLGTIIIRAASCGVVLSFVEDSKKVYNRIFDALTEEEQIEGVDEQNTTPRESQINSSIIWVCPKCGKANAKSEKHCLKCYTKKP